MKKIRIDDLPAIVPPDHYNLKVRRITESPGVAKPAVAALVRMDPNGYTDPHSHDDTEHLFIVLKGELGVKGSEGEVRIKPGEAVFVNPKQIHENFNAGGGEIEYISVTYKINA
jgi:quercetin dioxygenase-like cupin family protein